MLYCLPVAVVCSFWRANESRLMEFLLINRGPPGSKSVTTLIYGEWSYMDMFINMSKVVKVIQKIEKNNFLLQNEKFSLRELKFPGNIYFSYSGRLASAKVEKVLWLQRNDKEVTLLLIYHISGFYEKYSQGLPYK